MKPLSKIEIELGRFFANVMMEKHKVTSDRAVIMTLNVIDMTMVHFDKGERAFRCAVFISSRLCGASVKEANDFIAQKEKVLFASFPASDCLKTIP